MPPEDPSTPRPALGAAERAAQGLSPQEKLDVEQQKQPRNLLWNRCGRIDA